MSSLPPQRLFSLGIPGVVGISIAVLPCDGLNGSRSLNDGSLKRLSEPGDALLEVLFRRLFGKKRHISSPLF